MKVFLGGTTNDSTWRDRLIPLLNIDYFNPVVNDWDSSAQQEELYQRNICDFCLYVITPKMKGVYSIAEVVDDSNKRPKRTLFCYLLQDEDATFDSRQLKSLAQVGRLIEANGGFWFSSLKEIADCLNKANSVLKG